MEQHPLPAVKIGDRHFSKSNAVSKGSHVGMDVFPVLSSLGGLFSNGSQVTCELRNPNITFAKRIFVKLTIANADAVNAATLMATPFLFNQIQVFLGSDSIYTTYPENYWFNSLSEQSQEKTACIAAEQNWSTTTYFPTSTIAASSSATYIVPLDLIVNQIDLPLTHCELLKLQFYMTTQPLISTSAMTAPASLSITDFQVYLVGEVLSNKGLKAVSDVLASAPNGLTLAGYSDARQILNVASAATSSSTIQSTLSGFFGTYSSLTFLQRYSSTPQAENQIQYKNGSAIAPSVMAMENISLYDSRGQLWWTNAMPESLVRLGMGAEYHNSIFPTVFRSYMFNFTEHVKESLEDGFQQNQDVVNTWKIQYTPSGLPVGTTNLDLVILAKRKTEITVYPSGRTEARLL